MLGSWIVDLNIKEFIIRMIYNLFIVYSSWIDYEICFYCFIIWFKVIFGN